jgi:phage terminase large subunit GpA-like protein
MISGSESPDLELEYPAEVVETLSQQLRYTISFALRPDPLMLVSDWADKNRILTAASAAEPGPFRTSRTPYLKEIMDCLSFVPPYDQITDVVFMKGAQIGATECGNNFVGYIIDAAPGPALMVMPTVETMKRNSKQRIAPMIAESPRLREKVKEARSKDSGNTLLMKEFPGGVVVMTGANSAAGLRSMPMRYLFLDEIDAYPGDLDGEGDPITLAEQRMLTFLRRKCLKTSTPTITGLSRIEREFEESDQRYFFMPCPHCRGDIIFQMKDLRWPKGLPQEAQYFCPECGCEIKSHQKIKMLSEGRWKATNANGRKGCAGFHLSGLYSPWLTWADIAQKKHSAKEDDTQNKVFVNTIEGRTWADMAEAPSATVLFKRAGDHDIGQVEASIVFITAGVDVQKDRLEAEIVGWNRWKQSFSLDYITFEGNTAEKAVWLKLDELLERRWQHPGGAELQIRLMAVDSGYATQDVYEWARTQDQRRVMVTKGVDKAPAAVGVAGVVEVGTLGKKRKIGLNVWPVGTHMLKAELYRWLNLDYDIETVGEEQIAHFPPGYCFFPAYDIEYFEQLTAEQLVTTWKKNIPKREWQKTRRRNEALDCRIYARAAANVIGLDRWKESVWTSYEKRLHVTRTTDPKPEAEVPDVGIPISPNDAPKPVEKSTPQVARSKVARARRFGRSKYLGR